MGCLPLGGPALPIGGMSPIGKPNITNGLPHHEGWIHPTTTLNKTPLCAPFLTSEAQGKEFLAHVLPGTRALCHRWDVLLQPRGLPIPKAIGFHPALRHTWLFPGGSRSTQHSKQNNPHWGNCTQVHANRAASKALFKSSPGFSLTRALIQL